MRSLILAAACCFVATVVAPQTASGLVAASNKKYLMAKKVVTTKRCTLAVFTPTMRVWFEGVAGTDTASKPCAVVDFSVHKRGGTRTGNVPRANATAGRLRRVRTLTHCTSACIAGISRTFGMRTL